MSIRILVVESTNKNAALAKTSLAPFDCEVSPVTSISLGLFLANKTLPDLIVSGSKMVDGNGLDFLRELKADKELRKIPFVFICPASDSQLKEKALAEGADKFITHPLNADEFLNEISPYLIKHKQVRPESSPE